MGNCCANKPMPDIQADVKVDGNKCLNVKKMIFNCTGSCAQLCDCDNNNCCVTNNTTIIQTPPQPPRVLTHSQTAPPLKL